MRGGSPGLRSIDLVNDLDNDLGMAPTFFLDRLCGGERLYLHGMLNLG
jgi:hypothetical protein